MWYPKQLSCLLPPVVVDELLAYPVNLWLHPDYLIQNHTITPPLLPFGHHSTTFSCWLIAITSWRTCGIFLLLQCFGCARDLVCTIAKDKLVKDCGVHSIVKSIYRRDALSSQTSTTNSMHCWTFAETALSPSMRLKTSFNCKWASWHHMGVTLYHISPCWHSCCFPMLTWMTTSAYRFWRLPRMTSQLFQRIKITPMPKMMFL